MFRIGEFSKMSKTTIKTLRYYDEIGLLKAETTDKFTGYRLYSTKQLMTLHRIQSFRQVGLTIDEIKWIMSGHDAAGVLEKRRAELMTEISEGQNRLSRIEFILSGGTQIMNYTAIIKDLPECIVYSKKILAPSYEAYFELIPAIGEQVTKKYPDLKLSTPEYCFIVYLDGEYKEKDINIEFCEAVTEMKVDFEDVSFKKIPPIAAVSVLHKGSYQGLKNAYAFAFEWIEKNGYKAVENPRESYIDGIWNKESEEDWLTELQIPIVKL